MIQKIDYEWPPTMAIALAFKMKQLHSLPLACKQGHNFQSFKRRVKGKGGGVVGAVQGYHEWRGMLTPSVPFPLFQPIKTLAIWVESLHIGLGTERVKFTLQPSVEVQGTFRGHPPQEFGPMLSSDVIYFLYHLAARVDSFYYI